MKRNLVKLGVIVAILPFILNACSDSSEETDPCSNGPVLSVESVRVTVIGKSDGEIVVSAAKGASPLMYSIDGVNFQSNGTFSDLEANNYTITVKDANDCTDSKTAVVNEVQEVSYANQIRPIIDTNCLLSNCHGDNPSLPSYATYNDVLARASGIKTRTGNKTMPPGDPLADEEITLIADWVDQGAPNN